jgi:hypothetical protein
VEAVGATTGLVVLRLSSLSGLRFV